MGEEIQLLGGPSLSTHARDLLEMSGDARAGAEQVRKIVRSLKMFSRAEEERRVALDVHPVLDVSINMAFNEIRHRARLVKDYGDVPLVQADEGRLAQVFINLLVNAAQSIPEGHADKNEIRIITSTDAQGRAVIAVRDTGGGIPHDILSRIFDPFFTTKAIGIGSGLGLSICHGIVADLGGELSVETALDKGSTFRIVLPAVLDDSREEAPLVALAAGSGARGSVLIIDDDVAVARAVTRLISRDHEVVAISDARKALARIAGGDHFDVVLCDLMMPEMTGMEFHAELLEVAPAMAERVVFISGGAFTPAARAFLERVPNMRVEKPFGAQSLRALVRQFVRTT
jgi:CheY-like chemotaxis protein